MDFRQKLFIVIAKCLGADPFKKYWPHRGSYWNTRHMSKDKVDDLNSVIREANELTRVHVGAMVMENILIFGFWIFDIHSVKHTIGLGIILNAVHGYALMIHQYNRILANFRIGELKKMLFVPKSEDEDTTVFSLYNEEDVSKEIKEKLKQINENQTLRIQTPNGKSFYLNNVSCGRVGPLLTNLDRLIKLRDFYQSKIILSGLEIDEFFHLNTREKLYQEFLESLHTISL